MSRIQLLRVTLLRLLTIFQKTGSYRLEGYDTFAAGNPEEDSPFYPLEGTYRTLAKAEKAARARLVQLEKDNPTETSGGQGIDGVQDRVYIVHPDGSKYRFIG